MIWMSPRGNTPSFPAPARLKHRYIVESTPLDRSLAIFVNLGALSSSTFVAYKHPSVQGRVQVNLKAWWHAKERAHAPFWRWLVAVHYPQGDNGHTRTTIPEVHWGVAHACTTEGDGRGARE